MLLRIAVYDENMPFFLLFGQLFSIIFKIY